MKINMNMYTVILRVCSTHHNHTQPHTTTHNQTQPNTPTKHKQHTKTHHTPTHCTYWRQMHLTRHFFSCTAHTLNDVHSHHGSRMCLCASLHTHGHPCRAFDRLTLCSSPCSFPCVSPIPCSSLSTSTWTLTWNSSSMWSTSRQSTTGTLPTEDSGPLAEFTPLTGHEPKLPDDVHCWETSTALFRDESGDKDTEPSYLCDAELDDETIAKALSSPLFIQERGESADRRQAYQSYEESLLPAQSFLTNTRMERPVYEPSSSQKRKSGRDMENERVRILLERQKSKFSLILEPRFRNTSFKPILIGEVFRNWMELSSLSEEKLIILLQDMNNFDEINNFFMNNHQNKIGIFVKLIWKVFDGISRRRLIENQDTIHELTARIQEPQNEVNCLNDSRDLQDAESVRSGQSDVTSQPAFFPPFPDPGGMLSGFVGMLSRKDGPPSIWDTHGVSGNVFVNPPASSSSPYPPGQGFNPWISNGAEHTSLHVTSERQTPDTALDPRCQSGPSARNSFDPSEGRFSKVYGADQQRLQISDLHFNSPRQQHLLVGR